MTTGEVLSALLCCIWLIVAAAKEKKGYLRRAVAAGAILLLSIAVITGENLWSLLYYGVIILGTAAILIQQRNTQ